MFTSQTLYHMTESFEFIGVALRMTGLLEHMIPEKLTTDRSFQNEFKYINTKYLLSLSCHYFTASSGNKLETGTS